MQTKILICNKNCRNWILLESGNMCYDIKTKLEAQLKRAKHFNDKAYIEELKKRLSVYKDHEYHHAAGHAHPPVLIYTNQHPDFPVPASWGLIPHWVKNREQQLKLWNGTINARSESIFEKPAFREPALNKHCLVYVDGFYEHHHFNGKTYPFYIHRKDHEPFALAGLWDEWLDKKTGELMTSFTVLTTKANTLMQKIHNNPKLPEARMPVILSPELELQWLKTLGAEKTKKMATEIFHPYPENELEAYTVRRLRGKDAVGNVPEASEYFKYDGVA